MKNQKPSIDDAGIASGYRDGFGKQRQISTRTRTLIRAAMKLEKTEGGDLKVLRCGERMICPKPSELVLEDGTVLQISARLPAGVPMGYHVLRDLQTGDETRLIVTPGECHLPKTFRAWGWAVQLYALRSKRSWGFGDLRDLRDFNQWATRTLKSDFVLANPLSAAIPIPSQQSSPYYPSSRRFLNPLYLRVEDVPGAAKLGRSLSTLAGAGQALNAERLINRDEVFRLKMQALDTIWKNSGKHADLKSFLAKGGKSLEQYAVFCALAEHFKSGWTQWPKVYQDWNSKEVARFVAAHAARVRFHEWLQWNLEKQYRLAAKAAPIVQDLPVGVDPAGADAWSWKDMLAHGVSIGAPPDGFNSEGQNWGMQPFIPQRLRAAFYEPFRETLRAMLRFGGGLRIDHVMGLFRLFWIPEKLAAGEGAYVYYAFDELLAVLAIESQRAKAVIVGEDLGTVEPMVRAELRRQKVLSYRLLWFESLPIHKFPKNALAAVSTHDLFTVAGLWSGADVARQKKLGLKPNEQGTEYLRKKLGRRLRLKEDATVEDVILRTYKTLAKAPSRMATVLLEDALAVEERPNLPGTMVETNWSLALPHSLEEIKKGSLIKKIAKNYQRK